MQKQSHAEFLDGGANNHHGGGATSTAADEHQETVDIKTLQEFSRLLQSQPTNLHSDSHRRRQIQRVPPQMRRRARRSEPVYDPVMVSLGPYHHGKPELRQAEEFKHLCLHRRSAGDEKMKAFFYSKILHQIAAIRESYADVNIVRKYDDKSLALMMLLDCSIIIDFIHTFIGLKGGTFSDWQRFLGARSGPLMVRDMLVLENQIPFRVVKMLINLQYDKEYSELFIPRFLSLKIGVEVNHASIALEDEDPPLHLLEAFRRVLVQKHSHPPLEPSNPNNRFLLSGFSTREEINKETDLSYIHRSVMELKAKGIRVRPNSSLSLREISFRPNACFGRLHLPVHYVTDSIPVIYANMIALEVLPNGITGDLVVLSYAVFMKSLIQSPEDVKEMQERGVILNRLVNRERVVEVFKEIDTFGLVDRDVFEDVKREIEEHCNSRARTWIAELIYTRFRTPWTAMTLFAAVILLCLTFLQTFFTIHK